MATIHIDEASIPQLPGRVAVITGGASGIGYATAKILASRGAKVFILDLHPPQDDDVPEAIHYEPCDVTVWTELCNVFLSIGPIDMVFSNAGISEVEPLLVDELPADENGLLLEPVYPLIDVILRSALNVIKLSWSIMRKHGREGSIVLTSSSTAYAPELRLPLYSALKLTLVGLVRSLRASLSASSITLNAVAPAVTHTPLVSGDFLDPIRAAALPISSAYTVGMAIVFSATAKQAHRVGIYGKETDADRYQEGRWNGRVILILGECYSEIEEPLSDLCPSWFGEHNDRLTRAQQAVTDHRNLT
ncbi:MAG: hypothetical protein LQ343_004609 [Gyalolechia ehrenbergii]|nr:MAG: hypothetical protein LQ343_004609 [Gyalolechia ehrenbergii]